MKAEIKKRRSLIFDTNTLVSAAIFPNSKHSYPIYYNWRRRFARIKSIPWDNNFESE